jgi:hypothetical protein
MIDHVARFWRKVGKTPDCWLWLGAVDHGGYGRFWTGTKRTSAHRASYEINWHPIPAGMHVCHSCDNPRCVRPTHLFLGTKHDNMRDASRKGRINGTAGKPQAGAANRNARLNESDVAKIRTMANVGISQHKLAKAFNVSQTQINKIVRGMAWKHV